MAISYEVNPPKIDLNQNLTNNELGLLLENLLQRINEIKKYCKGIHVTDSVLGIPRVPPIITSSFVRKHDQNLEITASVRVVDKTISSITDLVNNAIIQNVNGVLVLKGDIPKNSTIKTSGLIPSQVVKHFNESGFNKKINFYLSIPSNPDFNKIQKKVNANPSGFITQVIHSVDQVSRIVDNLKPQGFKIIPIVLIPSEKNLKSAEFLKLDWSRYQENVIDFIKQIQAISGDVLVTSPNDFQKGKEILKNLS